MKLRAVYPVIAVITIVSIFAPFDVLGDKKRTPRFADFPVRKAWKGRPAEVKLITSEARSYRRRLRDAAKEKPNFAGHFRVVLWGCGSECIAGAILDLPTGQVVAPPNLENSGESHLSFCQSAYAPSGLEYRVDSKLLIVRCGLNFNLRQNKNIPDTYYYAWEEERVRLVRHDHVPSDVK